MIRLENVCKNFGDLQVLKNVNLEVKEGEKLVIIGPSGSGKSTTVRCMNFLEEPTSGQVYIDGQKLTHANKTKIIRESISMVFQQFNLYPHMTVLKNLTIAPMKLYHKSKKEAEDLAYHYLDVVGLRDKAHVYPTTLSGGQQQRIAIARAIVNEPRVLLLDEPLGALDLKLRQEMQYELIRLKNELGITFLYVTHDQEEALTMSDKVVVMNQGYIQQMGTPEEIYNEPENAFVADFIGDSNIIDDVMMEDRVVKICDHIFPCIDEGFGRKKPVDVVIRPEDIMIGKPGCGIMDGIVTSNVFIGVHYEMCIEAGGFEWLAQNTTNYPVGEKVSISVTPENIQIMNKPQSEDEEAITLEDFE